MVRRWRAGQTAAILFALCMPAAAVDIATLKPHGYVSDYAYVVDSASKAAIESYCARVEKATGAQIAFVTLNTLDGEPVEDFANDLFRRWGIGSKGKDEGLLLLLVVRERRSRLEVGRGLEAYITDSTAGDLLRGMRTSLQADRYGDALLTAAEMLGERLAQAKSVQIPAASGPVTAPRPPPGSMPADSEIPWPMIIVGLLVLFWIMGIGSRRGRGRRGGGGLLPGIVLGNMMSRSSYGSYGGYGGGGFGGYDSGDSFGGFGGGDSGGGGASGDW
ncbi:MAG TPA: TPM domain-containing protein [Bryobacteraceae bacterium]|nr:TPM domain-containing protein [Bryobacteraceae bacterium]